MAAAAYLERFMVRPLFGLSPPLFARTAPVTKSLIHMAILHSKTPTAGRHPDTGWRGGRSRRAVVFDYLPSMNATMSFDSASSAGWAQGLRAATPRTDCATIARDGEGER